VGNDNVGQYNVGPEGRLSPKAPASVPAGEFPLGIAVTADGQNVYVVNGQSEDISQYNVDQGGRLSSKSPPTVPAGEFPAHLAVTANRPPNCAGVRATPNTISPATRKFVTVTLSGATDPDGDPLSFHIDRVTQDERVSGTGIGDPTFPDARLTAAGADSNQVQMRAERSPQGDGRVYLTAFTVTGPDGARCSAIAKVSVPRHSRKLAVDSSPPSYDAFTGDRVP
jgi:hypothetical protein